MIKKPTLIMRALELEMILDHLRRLAQIYELLGYPEDAKSIQMEILILERRLYLPKKK